MSRPFAVMRNRYSDPLWMRTASRPPWRRSRTWCVGALSLPSRSLGDCNSVVLSSIRGIDRRFNGSRPTGCQIFPTQEFHFFIVDCINLVYYGMQVCSTRGVQKILAGRLAGRVLGPSILPHCLGPPSWRQRSSPVVLPRPDRALPPFPSFEVPGVVEFHLPAA